MRFAVPESPESSSNESLPPSPRIHKSSRPTRRLDSEPPLEDGVPGSSRLELHRTSSSSSTPLRERNGGPSSPPLTWEEHQFFTAVRLRLQEDPVDEYEERERYLAWRAAQKRMQENWKPISDLLQLPTATSPSSQPQDERHTPEKPLEEAYAEQLQELDDIFREIRVHSDKEQRRRKERTEKARKVLWDDVNKTIDIEEARLAKLAAEREEARRAEEDRQRRIREAEEARLKAEAKRKAEEEAERKREEEEKKEREKLRREEEEAQKKKAEEASRFSESAPKPASAEWDEYRTMLKILKTQVMPLVRGNKGDQSMVNAEWRKLWSTTRRSFNPKIGQVTNSQGEIDRIANLIHTSLNPTSPLPEKLYIALLSSLAKCFLLQAETEVTAKPSTAFPLARLIIKIIDKGHPSFPSIFMARLVGRSGGWAVGAVVPRLPEQSEDEYRKSIGYPPTASSESSTQVFDRLTGMLTLYAAILQTETNPPAAPPASFLPPSTPVPPHSTPHPFQLPRLWTILARICSSKFLLADRAAPQILHAVIETAGDRLLEVYGKQVVKLIKTLEKRCLSADETEASSVGGKDGKAARIRLGLLLEKWQKDGKVGGPGHEVGP